MHKVHARKLELKYRRQAGDLQSRAAILPLATTQHHIVKQLKSTQSHKWPQASLK